MYDWRATPEIKKFQVSTLVGGEGEELSESGDGVVNWPGVQRVYCPVHPENSYDPVSLALRHGRI